MQLNNLERNLERLRMIVKKALEGNKITEIAC